MRLINLFFIFITAFNLASCSKPKPEILRVYCYDSLMASGGLGEKLFEEFRKKCNCEVQVLPSGDGGQMTARFLLDQKNQKNIPHVLIGIDQNIWSQVRDYAENWETWRPVGLDQMSKELQIESGFLPFDFAPHAFMADTQQLQKLKLPPPQKLTDLLDKKYQRKFILEDPRTSTTGLGFLTWTHSVKGPKWVQYWSDLKRHWLTMPSGWDEAYALFLKGEAPLVWSYLTSQAYHDENGDTQQRYRAIVFEEGLPLQIEGAMLVHGAWSDTIKSQARQLLNLLVSPEIQTKIPQTNWMFPARQDVELPESFKRLPTYKALPRTPVSADQLLKQWEQIVLTQTP